MHGQFAPASAFDGEKTIRIKNVPGLPFFIEKPSDQVVRRWCKNGLWVPSIRQRVYLRAHRQGRIILTSVEAVAEFTRKVNAR